ncbi:DUF2971 domain-containing protein [Hymenobacter sp. HSC-4F20]|uniref:DUF2971 domain-containing protein n=1 Tax=Hymenobacter sp. HSC-4F20 TaxID=2864135 RepID=UPI001C73360B|nr:DUF2971 domain-containing protein [Hymenobacter sp. HSC-4F20]MBX0290119.1 DUF2971 domain-containing protein [Hymenobacter sp. HSC-4F20]
MAYNTDEASSPLDTVPSLYHYTDATGFLGMVGQGNIRMSNIHFQNDSAEHDYIFHLANEILAGYFGDYWKGFSQNTFNLITPVFTFSLTEQKDLLSQWRGYCPNGGYSFSFEKIQLAKFIARRGLSLEKVIYNKEQQIDILRNHIIKLTPDECQLIIEEAAGSAIFHKLKYLENDIHRFAPIFKHPKFEEEQEWRLIKHYKDNSINPGIISDLTRMGSSYHFNRDRALHGEKLMFRAGRSTIIPFLELPFLDEEGDEPFVKVEEVIVSPGPSSHLAKGACQTLLPGVPIHLSEIPYRNW